MKLTNLLVVGATVVALAGCATNQKVSTNQLGDEKLSCQEIKAQDAQLDELLAKARKNKGVSGANVAAVLLFWPAAVGNYMDADKAEELVNKRKVVLTDLYKRQRCDV